MAAGCGWVDDGRLYYTVGDQGANQGRNACVPNLAQRLPTRAEIEAHDFTAYAGKILRLEPDGGVPADNPELAGVRSHVFTYGHRNPQGLVEVAGRWFSVEQGPSSDDELNLLEAGMNYGWPHVAGFQDDRAYVWADYSAAADCASLPFDPVHIPPGVPIRRESQWHADDFRPPLRTFFTVGDDHDFDDPNCGPKLRYLCWPTIAPSDIVHYPADGAIVAWRNSLLITSLKTGAVHRLALAADGRNVQGDVDIHLRSANRYRAIAVDPRDSRRIYVATDTGGNLLGADGRPVRPLAEPGAILVFTHD